MVSFLNLFNRFYGWDKLIVDEWIEFVVEGNFLVKELYAIYAFGWDKFLNLKILFHFIKIWGQIVRTLEVILVERIIFSIDFPYLEHDFLNEYFLVKVNIVLLFSGYL